MGELDKELCKPVQAASVPKVFWEIKMMHTFPPTPPQPDPFLQRAQNPVKQTASYKTS